MFKLKCIMSIMPCAAGAVKSNCAVTVSVIYKATKARKKELISELLIKSVRLFRTFDKHDKK